MATVNKYLILPAENTITMKNMVLDVKIDLTSSAMKEICTTLETAVIYSGIPAIIKELVTEEDLPTVWTETITEFESNGEMCQTTEHTFDDSAILAL